jgi:amino acid transporter
MASDENDARAGISGNKAAVYVAAALIMGFLLYVGIGVLSADSPECSNPKASRYQGSFAPLRCRYKAR